VLQPTPSPRAHLKAIGYCVSWA